MDPRASIAEARQLGLQPPPRKAAAAAVAAAEPDKDDTRTEKGAPEKVSGKRPSRGRRSASPSDQPRAPLAEDLPGFARGNRRALTVSIPRTTLAALRQASEGSSMGAVAVEALRASYPWLVETYKRQPGESVGPFPAPVRQRRRRQVLDPTPVHLYMSPAEAAAVAQVADECDLSISELVTIGVDHHLEGAQEVAGAPPGRRPGRPAKKPPGSTSVRR